MQSRPSLKWWLVLSMCLMISLITTSALAAKGTVTTDSLILRKEASTDSKALQTLDKGTTLNLKSVSGSWYKVSYGTYSGYVMKKYVKADGDVPEAKEKKDTTKEESKKNEIPKQYSPLSIHILTKWQIGTTEYVRAPKAEATLGLAPLGNL